MRTTLTLDPDVEALVKKAMREGGLSFKQAVNQAIRSGLGSGRPSVPFQTPTFHMGAHPDLSIDHALRLAADMEDEEIVRKMALRK